ncbi:MAG: hypothetical protein EB017_10695 [Betaproteobacteria bacterium]|nr:hypothetical protein [Betaproteobacteria bacterium]
MPRRVQATTLALISFFLSLIQIVSSSLGLGREWVLFTFLLNLIALNAGCGQKNWAKGDRYFLYTDGLTDQIGRIGHGPARAFGNGRLMERLRQSVNNAAEEVNRSLGMALQQWQGPEKRRDDLSFLIVVL